MFKRLSLLLMVLVIGGCSLSTDTIHSPNGRYLAFFQSSFMDFGFTSFTIFDTQTNQLAHQKIRDAPAPLGGLDGVSFAWTPSEHYLVVVADVLASSHGCDELFVYTGDGRTLVFSTGTTTSVCRSLMADVGLRVLALCPNDDIVYTGYRLTPSTGDYVSLTEGEPYCVPD